MLLGAKRSARISLWGKSTFTSNAIRLSAVQSITLNVGRASEQSSEESTYKLALCQAACTQTT